MWVRRGSTGRAESKKDTVGLVMKVFSWVAAGIIGALAVWGLIKAPLVVLLVFGILALGAVMFVLFFFRRPSPATTLSAIADRRWHTVDLGADTVSGDGSSYAMYVRRGASPNLIIHFSGGGACWDGETASRPITPLRVLRGYTRDLRAYYFASLTQLFPAGLTGLANRRDKKNAFRDWTFVFVPYTTGDMHIGDAANNYIHNGRTYTVHHNGQANVAAALEWVFANVPAPGKVMVSGESSGAWASAFYAPAVAAHYTDKRVYCLSDGAGIVSQRWPDLFKNVWKTGGTEVLGFCVSADVYRDAITRRRDAAATQNLVYLHSNTLYDDTLTRFSAALNSTPTDTDQFIDSWANQIRESMRQLRDSEYDYRYFLTDWGHKTSRHTTPHTVSTNDLFHKCEAGGVTYSRWLTRNVIDDEALSVGDELLDQPYSESESAEPA